MISRVRFYEPNIFDNEMKSNQRWLKLRTTVQLSGALSSSMNRAKPPLKREDSFITRFSTRQIAELQDTVDHTDEEDISKTSTGSPKFRRKRKPRHPITVINPYENVYFYWLCVLTICVLYNLWTAIVREAFPELQLKAELTWYLLDAFTDLTYVIDILIQLRTGYLEQGLIVYDSKKLANHYLHSKYFLLDLVSIFPLDFLQFLSYIGVHPMIRFPRFVKVYRVYNYYYMVESRTLYPNFWRVLNLVHILLLLAHWFGCFYYMLSEAEKFRGDWTYPNDYGDEFKTLTRKYLGSVYWSTLTLTTIGDLPTPESDRHIRGRKNRRPVTETTTINPSNYTKSTLANASTIYTPFDPGSNEQKYSLPFLTLDNRITTTLIPITQQRSKISRDERSEMITSTWKSYPLNHLLRYIRLRKTQTLSNSSVPFDIPPQIRKAYNIRDTGYLSVLFNRPKNHEKLKKPKIKSMFRRDVSINDTWHPKYRTPYRNPIIDVQILYTQSGNRDNSSKDGNIRQPSIPQGRRGYRSRLLHIHTNGGYIFTIVSYLIGVFIFATIVGQVGNVIRNRNANRLEFERLLDGAKLYMRHHKVPREMQRRVQRWYDYSWSRGRIQGGGDINSALGLLPDKLRTELALHVNLSTLKKVSIFKECQPEFLHDLVLKMKAYIFTPGDLICRKGEVAREMFIIADGILEVISETGKVLTTMKAGDFFGEIGILNLDGLNKRTADVRSVGYSELFSLSREDVLAAMKDYPEAQEILQSLGRKRLMDARHKTGADPSSKIGSPTSPCRDAAMDDHHPKKIVSRLISDVGAIRNAFRRSKGMTMRDMETMELEPLTPDGKGGSEDDTPAVRRILKKLGRNGGSGSSETSLGAVRGVLKRMSRVTSDETQATSPLPRAQDDNGGVLGAGLPLLRRLKLLKEKEEREDRRRLDGERSLGRSDAKSPIKGSTDSVKEEPEVIGAGLPLFARLKLLKAKEEKEKLEREERGSKEKESDDGSGRTSGKFSSERSAESSSLESYPYGPPISISTEKLPSDDDRSTKSERSDSQSLSSQEYSDKSDRKPAIVKKETSLKSRLKAALQQPKDPPTEESKLMAIEKSTINDLNKGTQPANNEANIEIASNNSRFPSDDPHSKSNATQSGDALERAFSKHTNNKNNATMSKPATGNESAVICVQDAATEESKEKMQRRDSFKRAMDEGLAKKDEKDLNIPPDYENSQSEEIVLEEAASINKTKETVANVFESRDKRSIEKLSDSESEGRNAKKEEVLKQALKKSDSSPDDNNSNLKKTSSSLKVPSDEISPPLSSPESTETPERKSLKSILKRMSKEDLGVNLLPSAGVDLKQLMKAPTVQGFVARRSKLSKSVSFQRKTLSSPPPSALLEALKSSPTGRSSSQTGSSIVPVLFPPLNVSPSTAPLQNLSQEGRVSNGVQKLLKKLGTVGVDSSQSCQAEDLVRGVRKILRDKIEDVEVAWEARIEALQQEVEIRDATIRQLTDTIERLQAVICSDVQDESTSPEQGDFNDNRRQAEEHVRRNQGQASSSSSSDEDEPLFMRNNSIESIIHQSPSGSQEEDLHPPLESRRSWPHSQIQRQSTICNKQQRMSRSWDQEDIPRAKSRDVIIDVGDSSTDDDLCSFSSDDDHVYYGHPDILTDDEVFQASSGILDGSIPNSLDEEELEDDDYEDTAEVNNRREITDQDLNSQDWEVQMLARQLAQDQRGVARRIDRDIASGKLQSPLADLHEALATDDLSSLTDSDLLRLEKIVRREREKLRQFARMYSLDERPVLEDEFSSLYRSRSQLLLGKSSELCRAGPKDRRLSKLLNQLTSLPPSEQFLLDRLVYKTARSRRFSRQQSLCDERLSSYGSSRTLRINNHSSIAIRRSMSVCSPPPDSIPIIQHILPPPGDAMTSSKEEEELEDIINEVHSLSSRQTISSTQIPTSSDVGRDTNQHLQNAKENPSYMPTR